MAVDYPAVVKSFDPASYWRLGESEGVTAVDAIRGRNASYRTGNVLAKPGAIVGDKDTAVQFPGLGPTDANNGIIVVTDGVEIGQVTEATFMCWAKREGEQGAHTELVFNRSGQPTGQFADLPVGAGSTTGLTVVAGNSLGYHWNDGSNTYGFDSGLDLTDGAWNFCALTVTPTEAIFYLGDTAGNLTTSTNAVSHGATTLSTTFVIGGTVSSNAGRFFKGDIDEPAVFSHALTQSQINVIYQAGLNKTVPVTTVEIEPSAEVIYAGEGTLKAKADGTSPAFQWYLDGTAIEGATAAVLSGDLKAGSYTVKAGNVTSSAFTVLAASKPIVGEEPTGGGERYLGGRVTLGIEVTGSLPMSYQWNLNGKPIEGATGAEYAKILAASADFGAYTVTVSNVAGSVTSDKVEVTELKYAADSWTEAVMSRNPLAFFRFDDTIDDSSTEYDDRGFQITGMATDFAGGNVGYYYGVNSFDLIEGCIVGDTSKAVHFNGSSYLGTRLQLNGMARSGFTTMGWVRRDSDYGAYTTRGGYFGQNDLCEFGDGNSATQIESWCADGMQIKTEHNFRDKVWSLVVLTYDGSKLTLYLDGLVAGNPVSGTLNASAGTAYYFNVGGGGIFNIPDTNMDYFLGDVDEIAFFDHCMEAADVQEFYFKGHYGPGAAPDIRTQPTSLESYENPESAWTLSVVAGGTSPLAYQWSKDGKEIEGATDRTYDGFFTQEYTGSYTVKVSNNYGSVTSDTAVVSLRNPDPNSYEGVLVGMDPYAYWRFGEATGTTALEYMKGINGTYTANQTLAKAGALKGDPDTAVGFDGTSFVIVPGMSLAIDSVTMACWLKPNAEHDNFNGLMFDRGSSAVGIDIEENQLSYHWNDLADSYNYRSGLRPVTGEWNFVVMAVNSTSATFYLGDSKGMLKSAVNTMSHPTANLTSSFSIGGDTANADRRINGDIDEPVLFNRALSEEEIALLYRTGLSGLNSKPEITVQPADFNGFVGDTMTLSVSCLGTAPLTYQWYMDGEAIEGATSAAITKEAVTADNGSYSVVVKNTLGEATSEEAVVTIIYKPTSVDLTGEEYKLWTHLKFDNDVLDSTPNANNGVDASYGALEYGEAVIGTASVNVKTDVDNGIYNYVGFEKPLYVHTEPMTVAFWTKINTADPDDLPWLCNTPNSFSDEGFCLAPGTTSAGTGYAPHGFSFSLQSWDDDTGVNAYAEDNSLPSNEWHHLVFVMTPGATMKVFKDGEYYGSVDISGVNISDVDGVIGTLDNYSYPMSIGQTGSGNYAKSVDMLIDDMGIWRTALNDIDARSIYYAGLNGNSFDKKEADIKPTITSDPVGATVYQNGANILPLSVTVSGTEPITVTWTKDGTEVGTGLTLNVALTADAAGSYRATAKNSVGEDVSDAAQITFRKPADGYEALIAGFGPVAFWRFDDDIAGGIAADYATAHDGTYNNVVAEQQVEGAIYGDPSKSIWYKGTNSNSHISTPFQLNPLVETGAFSFMGWIKGDVWTEIAGLYGQNDLMEFGQDSAVQIRAWAAGAGNVSGTAPAAGDWNLVTITYSYDGTNMIENLYVNNVVVGQNIGTTPITATAGTGYGFNIGGCIWNATGGYFNGNIDDVAIFPTVLSAEDVALIYNIGKFGPGAAPEVETQPVGSTVYSNTGTFGLWITAVGTPPFNVTWYKDGQLTSYTGEKIEVVRSKDNAGSWTAKVTNNYGESESEPAVISYYEPKSEYEALIASLNPWVYWRLGEAQADGQVYAAEYGHGVSAPYSANNVLGLPGAIANDPDTAVSFTGAIQGTPEFSTILVPNVGMPTSEAVTFLVWVKRDGDQVAYSPLLFNRAGKGSTTGLNMKENNQIGYHWNDQSFSWGFASGLTLEDGAWNLAAMVVTPTEATFYLGNSTGELTTAANVTAHASTTITQDFTIGGQNTASSDRQFKGLLDEPVVFNYALTAEQIKAIYEKGRGGGDVPGAKIVFEKTDKGLVMTWEAGYKLQFATSVDATWTTIDEDFPDGYLYDGSEGTRYFRLIQLAE